MPLSAPTCRLVEHKDVPGLFFSSRDNGKTVASIFSLEEQASVVDALKAARSEPCAQIHPAREFGWRFIRRSTPVKQHRGVPPLSSTEDYLGGLPPVLKRVWGDFMTRLIIPDDIKYLLYDIARQEGSMPISDHKQPWDWKGFYLVVIVPLPSFFSVRWYFCLSVVNVCPHCCTVGTSI